MRYNNYMANSYPKTDHLIPTRWKAGQSGNPKGKPRGTKHISKWIRDMLEDESFVLKLNDGTLIKGAPIKAIVSVLIIKAANGDNKAFDLLAKYGYGTRLDMSLEFREPVAPILGGRSVANIKFIN